MVGLMNIKLTAEEKLKKARVQLQEEKPFFSYLAMHLKFIEADEKILPEKTMGIDIDGNLFYSPEFVHKQSEAQLKGCLTHEVMHCALEHLERGMGKDQKLCNVAQDIVVNDMLVTDGITLPDGGAIPNNHQFNCAGCNIKDINEKTSEEVYDEIYRFLSKKHKRNQQKMQGDMNGQGNQGFDKHMYGKGGGDNKNKKDGKGKGKGDGQKMSDKMKQGGGGANKDMDWKKVMSDALAFAKSQGKVPAGMERLIGKINETFIDWRGLLYRYITAQFPIDYTWARPSKRSHSLGFYQPAIEKESIDIVVAVDTSGSICVAELGDFMSEIVGIVNSFQNVNLTVIDCDCRINGVQKLQNASPSDVMNNIQLKGGGGTSHLPVFKWLDENLPNAKLLIAFTDGYTTFPNEKDVNVNTIWVVAGRWRADIKSFPFGDVLELPEHKG